MRIKNPHNLIIHKHTALKKTAWEKPRLKPDHFRTAFDKAAQRLAFQHTVTQ
jgi:hypothetical protein